MASSAKDRGSGLQHRYTLLALAGRLDSFGKENKAFKNMMWRDSIEIQDARLQESRIQLKKNQNRAERIGREGMACDCSVLRRNLTYVS